MTRKLVFDEAADEHDRQFPLPRLVDGQYIDDVASSIADGQRRVVETRCQASEVVGEIDLFGLRPQLGSLRRGLLEAL